MSIMRNNNVIADSNGATVVYFTTSSTFEEIKNAYEAGKVVRYKETITSAYGYNPTVVFELTEFLSGTTFYFTGSFIENGSTYIAYKSRTASAWSSTSYKWVPTTTSNVTSGSTAALTSGAAYTALSGKASTSDVVNTRFDGQWVAKTQELSTATAVNTYTIDLGPNGLNYLPNDNYNYEVTIKCHAASHSQTASRVIVSSNTNSNINLFTIIKAASDGSYGYGDNSLNLVIDSSRIFNFIIAGNRIYDLTFNALAYRRIGTNI